MSRDDFDWHVVDGQTQRELDVRAPTRAAAVVKASNANRGFGETVLVHPCFHNEHQTIRNTMDGFNAQTAQGSRGKESII